MQCSPLCWSTVQTVAACYMKCNPPLCLKRDTINGNTFLTSPPALSHPILAIHLHFQHSLPIKLGIPHETCPFDLQTVRGKAKARSREGGKDERTQQERGVWMLQRKGMLQHRLYETPDAQAQTYRPQKSNKKDENMDIV